MKLKIKTCARCQQDHEEVDAQPLLNPPDAFSHFAICPTTGQPILVKLLGECNTATIIKP
jgi:hypothetical protein